jgi:hypothetical protein
MDTQPRAPAVLDDGTGVYLWTGVESTRVAADWIFKALFRCERCNRAVTIVRFEGFRVEDHWLRSLRTCPGDCASIVRWLPSAAG